MWWNYSMCTILMMTVRKRADCRVLSSGWCSNFWTQILGLCSNKGEFILLKKICTDHWFNIALRLCVAFTFGDELWYFGIFLNFFFFVIVFIYPENKILSVNFYFLKYYLSIFFFSFWYLSSFFVWILASFKFFFFFILKIFFLFQMAPGDHRARSSGNCVSNCACDKVLSRSSYTTPGLEGFRTYISLNSLN